MRKRFLGSATLMVALLVLLIAGFACLLLFVSTAKQGIVAELKATDKADEFACEFPPVLKSAPPTLGFISWRYTIRLTYDFGADSLGMHNSLECSPPPASRVMMAIGGAPAGARAIHFDTADGVLEPYVRNICLRPLTRKWMFKFPQELPKRLGPEDQIQE
jgi:hypothetical protein